MRFGIQAICGQDDAVYRRAVETGRLAESLGFDFYSIFDHPMMQADPFILLTAVAMQTEARIRVGSTVLCGLYRHPTQLARLVADLDGISGGRAICGLGSGWMEREFAAMEVPFGTPKERQDGLDEAIEIILGLQGLGAVQLRRQAVFDTRVPGAAGSGAIAPPAGHDRWQR
ncbi:MAG: LLM class flavin-dependent oxidoreductase [Thermomicrobiales bacterium]